MAVLPPMSPSAGNENAGDRHTSTATDKRNSATTSGADAQRVKLQHFLVLKAFNLRKGKQTLLQQFQPLKERDPETGRAILSVDALCAYLAMPPFRRLVLRQVFRLPSAATHLDFDSFLQFLDTAVVHAAALESDAGPPQPPPRHPMAQHGHRATDKDHHALVVFAPSLLSTRLAQPPPPAPGLWKKREITIQERITEYTKIDEQGRPQRLVETEKHQSEVIHMEALDGEFAHRELTQYEQLEQLNDEVVHHERGREEFVHLKSQHDEVSRFDSSSVPAGGSGGGGRGHSGPEECEQAPPSPTIKRDPSAFGGVDGAREEEEEGHSPLRRRAGEHAKYGSAYEEGMPCMPCGGLAEEEEGEEAAFAGHNQED